MQKLKSSECASCGGVNKFDPTTQSLVCQKCGVMLSIEKDHNYKSHHMPMDGDIPELQVAGIVSGHCAQCGAVSKSKGAKIANFCEYCGANIILDFSTGDAKPDACIPFAFDIEAAKKYYHEAIKKAKFLPNSFRNDPPDDNIEALYFPAFKFDFDSISRYQATLVDNDDDGDCHYRKISGTYTSRDYDLILESSDYLTQSTLLQLAPYNMQGLVKFQTELVMGFSVEHFNRKLVEMRNWAKNAVSNSIRSKILRGYSYSSVQNFKVETEYKRSDYTYTILPVYKINYKFKNKEYNTYINGQTGKLGGKLPRSGLKITLFILGILAAVAGVVGGIIALVK